MPTKKPPIDIGQQFQPIYDELLGSMDGLLNGTMTIEEADKINAKVDRKVGKLRAKVARLAKKKRAST